MNLEVLKRMSVGDLVLTIRYLTNCCEPKDNIRAVVDEINRRKEEDERISRQHRQRDIRW